MPSFYNSTQVCLIRKHLQKEGTGTAWILHAKLFLLPAFHQAEKLSIRFVLLLLSLINHNGI